MARALVRFSYQELQAEVRRRQRSAGNLERRRDKMLVKLRRLEQQIREFGGELPGNSARPARSNGRARNSMTLADALGKALKGKTMSVTEAADAVKRAGYRTKSNSFRTQVNIALIKSEMFKRVGRGQYTAK